MANPNRSSDHNMVCGPLDAPTDVILRIMEEHIQGITTGKKNHEYRDYILDEEVNKVWLYIDEKKSIQYVLTIGTYKVPGQVNEPLGTGNKDFDLGKKFSRYGYQIYYVHKLPRALGIDELHNEFGVDMTTRGKQYTKRALVDKFPLDTLEHLVPNVEMETGEPHA